MLVDTHAHLTLPEFAQDLQQSVERARAAGVASIVCVAIDLPSSREAVDLAGQYPEIAATVGVHPNECAALPDGWLAELRSLATMPRVVAIGEIGLDYYRERTEASRQQEVFQAQLDLAREIGLPVAVHNRQADHDMADILREWNKSLPVDHRRGVLHCFSGDLALLNRAGDMGFYLSFAGPITYRNARRAAEMVVAAPRERLLVETDSPYLAPHPHRGERNEPAFVRLVAERMAELRGESLDDIAAVTGRNAATLFGLGNAPASWKRD